MAKDKPRNPPPAPSAGKPRRPHRKVPNPRPPNDRGQGAKPFEPTADDRRIVQAAKGTCGMRHDLICQLIINPKTGLPIDVTTLMHHFSAELAAGKAKAHFNVGKSLYDQAVGIPKLGTDGKQVGWISEPDKIAAIWFSKAQMGWRERVSLEITDLEAIVAGLGGNVAALRAVRAAIPSEED